MALERLECVLTTEDQFSNLNFVHSVRRDPQLGTQVYLVDSIGHGGKFCFSFLQALGDSDGDRITYFTLLKHKLNSSERIGHTPGCAIDERQKLLYILYGGGQLPISLKLFHLTFQAADKFGYRRVGIQEGPCVKIKNGVGCRPLMSLDINTLTVAPSGRLVTQCMIVQSDDSNPIGCKLAVVPADVIYKQGKNKKAVLKTLTDQLPFLTPLQSMQIKIHPPVFSPSNHLLFWHGFNFPSGFDVGFDTNAAARKVDPSTDDDGRVIFDAYNIPGHTVNGHINTLKIDPVEFVESFQPGHFGPIIADVKPPQHLRIGAHLELLGRVHKFVLFGFGMHYILAAKWPKEWYKLPELPIVGVSKVIKIDKGKKVGHIYGFHLVSTVLYIKTQLGDAHSVGRIELGHFFKDYRCCAFCDKQEVSKMRNREGKRVSRLKVCRKCKELNLHLVHSTCHYCSDECQRKHWKEHKTIHERAEKVKMMLEELVGSN